MPDVSFILDYYGNGNTAPVTPVAFTPPGAQSPQLYLFDNIEPNEAGAIDIACVPTGDGETWTAIAPDGLGVPELSQTFVSAAVYGPPGAASEQIYIFFNSASTLSYVSTRMPMAGSAPPWQSQPRALSTPSTVRPSTSHPMP